MTPDSNLTKNDTPSTVFSHFTAEEFLTSLVLDGNIHIVDGKAMWDQPASSAAVVRDGIISNVPAEWTYGDLLVRMAKARVGSTAVELSMAKVAIYKAHEAECRARASAASAEALQQQADDLGGAAVNHLYTAMGLGAPDQAGSAPEVSRADAEAEMHATVDAQSVAQNAKKQAAVHAENAARALEAAQDAIQKIPAQDRPTFIATLAPEFAHLAGEMEYTEGHPPKPSFSGVPADLCGFVCTGCKVYNLVRSGQKEWYAVYAGKKVGIFHGTNRATPLVKGVSGSSHRGFFTREEAEAAFYTALLANNVHVIPTPVQ